WAAADPSIKTILLLIDSPGGTIAGTAELADSVAAANKIKPVIAHADDQMASAAYWIASQCRMITSNRTALVGSIGTYVEVYDTSKMYENAGVKVHMISTGPHKGALVDGTPVTDDQLAEVQKLVDSLNRHFLAAVSAGRKG